MKIRHGFVSNSSSSSYIVFGESSSRCHIPESAYTIDPITNKYQITLPDRNYTYEFGWEDWSYTDVMEKLNFASIQAHYMEDKPVVYADYMEKILSAVTRDFKETHPGESEDSLEVTFDFEKHGLCDYPYIDHQSASYEGENIEMFASDEDMDDFLFNPQTFVQGGNDNDFSYD